MDRLDRYIEIDSKDIAPEVLKELILGEYSGTLIITMFNTHIMVQGVEAWHLQILTPDRDTLSTWAHDYDSVREEFERIEKMLAA